MKKKLLSVLLIILPVLGISQPFWTENFGLGCSTGNPAAAYSGPNGTWTVSNTGTNDSYANQWYVSATEAGMGVGNCGDGCGNNASLTNRTLHLGANTALIGDAGAAYNAGGLCVLGICVLTDKRAESPTINCLGKSNITLSFSYIQQGSPGSDFASLCYYDGTSWFYYNGSSWVVTNIGMPATLNSSCGGQGLWTNYSVQLPASANNNPNVKIGFRWVNNDDGVGTDPSFAVDDIALNAPSSPTCSVSASLSQPLQCFNDCNGIITTTVTGTAPFTYWWNSNAGTSSSTLSGLCAGTNSVFITDAAGCTSAVATVNISQPPQLTASVTPGSIIPCYGDCTGSLFCTASGGTGSLSYQWSNGSTSSQITNVCAGTYTITITDANNCQLSFYSIFTQPDSLVFASDTLTAPSCPTCNDGSICPGTVIGGTGPYSFSISPSAPFVNGCFEFLTGGVYQVCATDANGCTICHTDTLGGLSAMPENGGQIPSVIAIPNPIEAGATLQLSIPFDLIEIQLVDLAGKTIVIGSVEPSNYFTIPLSVAPGCYIVKGLGQNSYVSTIITVK
ncbi:MAG: T9SS type A sorting domain-containing protein [Bacteroidota bacterium]